MQARPERTASLALRAKLSFIVVAVIAAVMLPFGWFTVRDFEAAAMEEAASRLRAINAMLRNTIAANQDGLKVALLRLGTVFRQGLQGEFSIDEGSAVTIGGIKAPLLKLNGKAIGLDHRLVNQFGQSTGGSVASIFVRVGDDFLRISTSVLKEDGSPAIGTFLGKDHPAYEKVLAGESYLGQARLFGRQYMTEYQPLRDRSGRVIGLLFVGLDFTDSIVAMLNQARELTIGKSGYVFIIDSSAGEGYGHFVLHPAKQGKNALAEEEMSGSNGSISEMLARREGVLTYEWRNPELGETMPRRKMAAFSEYRDLGWIIGTSGYVDDFLKLSLEGRNRMILAMAIVSVLAILALNIAVGNWVVAPMLRLQRRLSGAGRTLRTVLDNMHEAVFLHRADGSLVDVNAKMLEMYGVDKEQALDLSFFQDCCCPDEPIGDLQGVWQRVLDGGIESFQGTARRPLAGTSFPIEAVLCKCSIEGEDMVLANVRDITERRQAEMRTLRLNRTLRVLSRCNEALVRSADVDALLHDICKILVDIGGYRMAWIGFADEQFERRLHPAAHYGHDDGYLDLLAQSSPQQDPSLAALRGRRVIQLPAIASESARSPWREAALERGYEAIIAFPLGDGASVFGILSIYSSQPQSFDQEEIALLTELAEDLAFGIVSLRNAQARYAAESALRLRDRAMASSTDAILIVDLTVARAPIVYANDAAERITGYPGAELLGRGLDFLADAEDGSTPAAEIEAAVQRGREYQAVARWLRKNGESYWGEISLAPVREESGQTTHVVSIIKDVTERMSYQEQLEHHARYDGLTGLPNRSLLIDRLDQAVIAARRKRQTVAVSFIDLDHFKYVNDSLGHRLGDKLLQAVAQRLRTCLREEDTVARQGGDEFVVLLPDYLGDEQSIYVLRRIQTEIAKPFAIDGRQLNVTASIGVSLCPQDGEDGETLLRNADMAMYRAKDSGRNNIEFFTAEMNQRVQSRLQIEFELRHAIERDQLFLHYQPQFADGGEQLVGFEALLRWQHPELGLVPPARFIPIAEESGLILAIGEWVLRTACRQAAAWQRQGVPVKVAVNVSAQQFQQQDQLIGLVREVLAETGLAPRLLELEITESMLMKNPPAMIALLHEIKALGVKLALDDFGTGYSSFSYLKRFPIDLLKIDQAFVRDICSEADAAAIVAAIISMAHALRIEAIAEGVETREQLDFLCRSGCDQIQGYYLGRPIPVEQINLGRQEQGAQA